MINIYFKIILSFYLFCFWLRWVFIALQELSLVAASGGVVVCGAQTPGARASVVVARGLSSCGAWA